MDSERHLEESSDSTRERLLAAGLKLLAEEGYRGATAREIARAAGVTEVTLYRHFRSKDELFAAAVTDEAERLVKLVPEPSGNMEDDLRSLARYVDEHLSAERDRIVRVLPELHRRSELLGQDVVGSVRRFHEKIIALFRHYQRTGELTSDMGDEVTAVFLGPMYANALLGEVGGISVSFDYEQYVRHFLSGYRNAKKTG
jgi:AcrR family transcriptional regulator